MGQLISFFCLNILIKVKGTLFCIFNIWNFVYIFRIFVNGLNNILRELTIN